MLTLYTIGHSNQTAEEFLALLQQHSVKVLVDVRSHPVSKYVPHFNKDALQSFLETQGLSYRYAGQYLGGQPDDPTVYRTETVPDAGTSREKFLKKVDYVAVMRQEWYLKGIQRLLQIMTEAEGGVAIMCSEAAPHDCHRYHLITRSLLDPLVRVIEDDIQVIHILRDGSSEAVDLREFDKPTQLSLF